VRLAQIGQPQSNKKDLSGDPSKRAYPHQMPFGADRMGRGSSTEYLSQRIPQVNGSEEAAEKS